MSQSPEVRIIHDHSHLNALLSDLDRALRAWSGDLAEFESSEDGRSPLEDAREIFGLLKDDTYEHFEREEHGLFPNLRSDFPELREVLDGLHNAHDEICGQLEELGRLLASHVDAQPEVRARVAAAGKRLGELYWKHTAVEWEMIRNLLERLDEDKRAIIMAQLREI